MNELKGRCGGLVQERPCARPGPHLPATVCSVLLVPCLLLASCRSSFSSGSRHSGWGWAATLLSILCHCLAPCFYERTDEGKKVQEAHQMSHDPQLLFLHPNLGSRASLKSKAEAGHLIIVQLGVSRQRLWTPSFGVRRRDCELQGALGPSYWPSSVPWAPPPGCLSAP